MAELLNFFNEQAVLPSTKMSDGSMSSSLAMESLLRSPPEIPRMTPASPIVVPAHLERPSVEMAPLTTLSRSWTALFSGAKNVEAESPLG